MPAPPNPENSHSPAEPRRVAVVGGGISGLAAAHRLVELDPTLQVTLFESSGQLGGILQTVRRDGFLIERSADNFLVSPAWGVDLCRRVGLADELLTTDESRRQAFVVHRGQLVAVPAGFSLLAPSRLWPVLTSPLLSPAGKLRLAWEYFVPARRADAEESLGQFARRRLGREAFERLVQPLVSGIYTADPERLSVAATLPRFLEMERQHGGLIRGARRMAKATIGTADEVASGARYGLFVAPRDGMASLVAVIAARLPAGTVRLNTAVTNIERLADGHWRLTVSEKAGQRSEAFDALIIAAPSHVAAKLLAHADAELAADLKAIEHASSAVVSLGYRRDQITHPLDGFGFVVPTIERRQILAGSFASLKFPGRAPDGSVLIRVFIGGALQPELLQRSDTELEQIATRELAELLGIRGDPTVCELARWPHAMPQYHVGHREVVARIEARAAALANFALAGNAFHGVGVPNCIRSGELAAERIAAS